jgi:hypothetical protein
MKRINQTKLRGYFISIACSLLLLLITNYSWSQNSRTITGVLKDAKGASLSGASFVQKGTANGTALACPANGCTSGRLLYAKVKSAAMFGHISENGLLRVTLQNAICSKRNLIAQRHC